MPSDLAGNALDAADAGARVTSLAIMNILVAGSSGLIGRALVPALVAKGHTVRRLVRPTTATAGLDAASLVLWDPAIGDLDPGALDGVDAVVNLAGRSIGERRWSAAEKRRVLDSRVAATGLLARAIAAAPRPPALVNASAVGYYGNRGDTLVSESDDPGSGFLAEVCVAWEAATEPARQAGARVVTMRTGIVLTVEGGAIGRLLAPLGPNWLSPYRWGLGGVVGRGRQWWSWISFDDAIAAIVHLVESDVAGPVNLVTGTATHRTFIKAVGKALRRPTVMPIPPFVVKLLLGGELARALVLEGQKVDGGRLRASGFGPGYDLLEPALVQALHR